MRIYGDVMSLLPPSHGSISNLLMYNAGPIPGIAEAQRYSRGQRRETPRQGVRVAKLFAGRRDGSISESQPRQIKSYGHSAGTWRGTLSGAFHRRARGSIDCHGAASDSGRSQTL